IRKRARLAVGKAAGDTVGSRHAEKSMLQGGRNFIEDTQDAERTTELLLMLPAVQLAVDMGVAARLDFPLLLPDLSDEDFYLLFHGWLIDPAGAGPGRSIFRIGCRVHRGSP